MKAIITGVTGQDGSYLAELLVEKGYDVVGIARRSSTDNRQRLRSLRDKPNFRVVEGDVGDPISMDGIIRDNPDVDEVYNLAAQSHVGTSFKQPVYTWDVNAKGPVYIMDAISNYAPHARFYQASTSELFGNNFSAITEPFGIKVPVVSCKNVQRFQNETTHFDPQSPYAVAKRDAHDMVKIYRKQGMWACAGILFNHETITYSTPLIIRDKNGVIDILPIGDIARFHTGVVFDLHKPEYQSGSIASYLDVWDKNCWTKATMVSGYPHEGDKQPRIINARNSCYAATGSHVCIMQDGSEKTTSELNTGDKVDLCDYPCGWNSDVLSLGEAEFLGMLVGDGNLHHDTPRFTNKDMAIKKHFVELWNIFANNATHKFRDSLSGFTGKPVGQVECYGNTNLVMDIYTEDISVFGHKLKKVPKEILNSSTEIMMAFLRGYNTCDGLKANPCTYEFKNFKTNSPTLAAGLLYLISKTTGQKFNITVEESWKYGKQQFYYSINLLSDRKTAKQKCYEVKTLLNQNLSQRAIHRQTGISRSFIRKIAHGYIPNDTHHLERCAAEIKKIIDIPNYHGWFFDLTTDSGTFHAGVGKGVVHNSPRRGSEFVTRKVTQWLGRFLPWKFKASLEKDIPKELDYIQCEKSGEKFPKLRLGNLEACRDWGYAPDYVEGMWRMMQQDEPRDFVLATGETHSVEEFVQESFRIAMIRNWRQYVYTDPEFYRPCEVDFLHGDASLAREVLGWEPSATFKELVRIMVNADRRPECHTQ